ncbi:Transcriptional adapter like [Actinidia chinensis var. chinensis]|uniref:Transcriptional adapter like n=1 Tax=Actinidia chinensis var. chinensis TaxID=1590841 RepID=A0A2R6PDB0_ACTCC|nr:Transcriptional adapter like [Actinidia chinensis var. chinensis]
MCREMQPTNQHQRINLAKLKAQIVKKLGPEGSKQYFYCLNRFLSLKLSRVEFNKLCIRIVGRENISLHNQFVHSILKNACSAKVPPLIYDKEVQESVRPVGNKEHSEGHKQSVSGLSNGYILPSSPRKARTGTRDRKASDCPSAQEPNGKANFVSRQLSTEQDSKFNVSLENGDLTQHYIERLVHHHQGVTEQANNEGEVLHHLSSNFLTIKRLPDDSTSVHSKDQIETVDFENRKEVPYRSELCAPLGVPSCPVSVGGARKTIPVASSSNCSSSFTSGCLLDTATLRERMEQIAAAQGLEGVSMDSANLLNNGLDAYLRGLILACIELVRARLGNEPTKSSTHKHQAHSKLINGVKPNDHIHSGNRPMEIMQERTPHRTTSLLDFRVAMELNPQQLGEDWPLLLEKICTQSFEE